MPPLLDSPKITVTVDNSPPTIPIVSDDGIYTNSNNRLHSSWTSSADPESGIKEYQYAIGTAKGATDLVSWSSNGLNLDVTRTGLSLTEGQSYYITVNAINGVNLSNVGYSDGIIVDTTAPVITITSPANGFVSTTQPIAISGTIDDNQASVSVNGIAATVIPAEAGIHNFTASGIPLNVGQNTIAVTATDLAGNSSSSSITVTYQPNSSGDTTPPSINIYTPDKDATTRSNIIYGGVSDDAVRVTVNDIDAELSNATFVARPPLAEGQNTVTVKAWDAAGNLGESQISFAYNTATPKVTITSPVDNSEIDISPIKVQGTNTTDLKYILVGSLPARIDGTNFTIEGISLTSDHTVITAEGRDANDNLFEDSVFVTSPQLANYQFSEVLGSTYEYEDTRPVAGATHILKVTLEKNNQLAPNEEIQFNVVEGGCGLSQSRVFTNDNGEAQVILTTDTNSSATNKVDCFVSNNPLVKTTFVVYTKPGAPSTLTKISDDSITPVPGATVDLIVKLTDSNNNPIPNENINFQVIQGTGTLSTIQAATASYGEAKVILTASVNPNETTQVTATSATNPNLSVTFNIATSQPTPLTFDDIMNKVNENGNKIQDFMADIVKTSDEPGVPSEEGYKIWQKGDKTKIQLLYPEQRSYIIERTENSINLNGAPFLTIEEQGSATMTTTDSIESFSGDIFVLKRSSISPNFQQITKIYVDYSKGIITKVCSEYSSEVGKGKFEEERSCILIDEIWVADNIIKKSESLIDDSVYTTTENFSNIMLNSGIPDSVFQ
ncbi:MAG: hypothetical protein A3I43_04215 [Omnitrophica WOR_2 bacterium RIFCSPLOWO2_02_FULL_50_19]|nr:MAG: hypothetical protein A3I43_04215 [Omnitrophica WOR_2 bacterium RIFCSPLOWO2_02_FULL_50_19]